MKSVHRILLLIAGIILAAVLILFSNSNFAIGATVEDQKKPELIAPASTKTTFV